MLPYIDGETIRFYRKIVSGCKANILFKPEFDKNNKLIVVDELKIVNVDGEDEVEEPKGTMSCSVVKGQYWLLNEISPILLQDYENVSKQ